MMAAQTGAKANNFLWEALVASAVHGLIWLTLFGWLAIHMPLAERALDQVAMKLPRLSGVARDSSRVALEQPHLFGVSLITFVAVDCWILWRLSRSGYRIVREAWSGLMSFLPTVLVCLATIATLLPY